MGNPPFVGARLMSKEQKADVERLFHGWKNLGNLDYVCCWYKKAADFCQNTPIRAALVSTNSICQGDLVAILWKPLFAGGVHIDFAYRTFRWDSESTQMAHVHCVIVGFSAADNTAPKRIFSDRQVMVAKNINGYLLDAENVFVENRNNPLCAVPDIGIGNKPIDNGNYLFTKEEMEAFIKQEPAAAKFFKQWYGSWEFINRQVRYCLWLGDCPLTELKKMPLCKKRVEAVRAFRLASQSAGTRKLADQPTRFHVENMPDSQYLIIPRVSSEKREYIPMAFMPPAALASDSVHIAPQATLYHFGILESNVHMAWTRVVAGRLKSDYRYSKKIVYNNFPWPNPTEKQKAVIEETARVILDARAKEAEATLSDLYDDALMPPELRKAHRMNDKAVMLAYGFDAKRMEDESYIVARLMEMYVELAK
ncbi:MAG: class I SAM-dependent DNA methyltransferase [Selenomonadaceae bacterium]|nr:class I SAM-dependent DNA methyltransferase [Selenomonadaceae bacterium]